MLTPYGRDTRQKRARNTWNSVKNRHDKPVTLSFDHFFFVLACIPIRTSAILMLYLQVTKLSSENNYSLLNAI